MRKLLVRLIFAFGLVSVLLGCTGTPSSGTVIPATTAGSTGAAASPEPTPRVYEVTLADNNKVIELCRNELILLKLGEGYDWTVTIADQTIISRVVNITVVRGAQGLYEAHVIGRTSLEAVGDPTCRQSKPPCEAPSLNFKVTISVVLSPDLIGAPLSP
jgi:hypothetical protein